MKIQELLRSDRELYEAYKANIAMFVYDAICSMQKRKRCGNLGNGRKQWQPLNRVEIHQACNEGADNFLKELTKEVKL